MTALLSGTRSPIQDGAIGLTVTNLAEVSSGPDYGVSYAYSCGVSIDNLNATTTVSF